MSNSDDPKLATDPKYKQFIQSVDKALKIFESSSEWADLISCLGKLNKVVQTYSQFSVVPRKLLIGKRLAQCLHPALPSGVHLKTLDCYNLILTQIGPKRLAQDLFIYSVGLFPLLGQASTAVRPVLLSLYETHFLPLKKKLYPGLSGFLVALLPGIEEGSEFTDRTTSILQKLCSEISGEIFFSCLWDTVLHSSFTRLSALLFVNGYIAKKPEEFKNLVIGKDVTLMVNAVCASLDDPNVLVQRITLDFVISFITFHSTTFSEKHVVKLLTYALGVLLRRDMSLNRRIFQWFLNINSDGNPVHKMQEEDDDISDETSYFDLYVREPLTIAMIILFQNVLESIEGAFEADSLTTKHRQIHLKPFRILITLLDKPEVGSAILNDIMLEIFRTLYKHSQVRSKLLVISIRIGKEVNTMHNELIKNANLLFSSLESYFIWEYLSKTFKRCIVPSENDTVVKNEKLTNGFSSLIDVKLPTHLETFQIISYLLDVVSVETSMETQSEHWPNLLRTVIQELIKNSSKLDLPTLDQGISLMSKLFSRLSPTFNQPELQGLAGPLSQQGSDKTSFSFSETTDGIEHCTVLSKTLFSNFVKEVVLKNDTNLMLMLDDEGTDIDFNTLSKQDESRMHCRDSMVNSGDEKIDCIQSNVAETFQVFCQYLVKVSCFPYTSSKQATDEDSVQPPEWLTLLLVCCCFNKQFDIQSSAMSTLLDLVNVTLTVDYSNGNSIIGSPSTSESISKITPLISSSNLKWMQNSNLFKVVASNLWKRLSPHHCHQLQHAAQLFLRLHNISPSSGICEDIINTALVANNVQDRELSHWRFTVLWHLSRDFYKDDNNKANTGTRTIDKCMFLMIDSLCSENLRLREIAKQWLEHAINFGDIGRILETILLVLLGPSTSRIAIHYISLQNEKRKPKTNNSSSTAKKATFVKQHSINADKSSPSDGDNGDRSKVEGDEDNVDDASNVEFDDALEDKDEITKSRTQSEVSSNGFADDEVEDEDDLDVDEDDEDADEDDGEVETSAIENPKNGNTTTTKDDKKITTSNSIGEKSKQQKRKTPTHPLLIHKLLYTQRYDHQQCLYALSLVSIVLKEEGRAFICSAATTSMSVCNTPHQSLLRELLIRHRRALSGSEFYGSLADAHQLLIRASTAKYLEILLSVCLYFIRSDYQKCVQASPADLEGNFAVQQASAKVLTQISYLLLEIAQDSGRGFSVYVNDLLSRSKIQRIALHCLLSTVYAVTGDYRESRELGYYSMVENPNLLETINACDSGGNGRGERSPIDLQVSLLKFIESLVYLESCIGTENPAGGVNGGSKSEGKPPGSKYKSHHHHGSNINKTPPFEYVAFKPIVSQPMFVSAALTVLREKRWTHMHASWIKLLVSCLPKFNRDMSKVIVPVVYQLCANLKSVTKIYRESYDGLAAAGKRRSSSSSSSSIQTPPDYMLVLLNGLTSFCHYCLISTTTGGTLSSTAGRVSSKHHKNSVDETSSLFLNLVQVFSGGTTTPAKVTTSEEGSPALNETRDGLLGILPAIITAISAVWKAWDPNKFPAHNLSSNTPLPIGQPKTVRLSILQLITPIAMNHTVVFLASIADVWCLYRDTSYTKPPTSSAHHNRNHHRDAKEWIHLSNMKYVPAITEDQTVLLSIIQAIKALTLDTIVDTSKQVLRQLLSMKERNQPVPLEVCMLQFLYELLSKGTTDQDLVKIKTTLLTLLKDSHALNLTPPALFVLMAMLNIYVHKVPIAEERRARREIQDLVTKFLESLNSIAASSLESSAWFRRSLQVVTQQDQSSDLEESTSTDKLPTLPGETSSLPPPPPTSTVTGGVGGSNGGIGGSGNSKTSQFSVPAILILAEYLAPMMDLVYVSEEKDKIASALVYLIYNIIPYLKNHSNQNITGYRASSALLAAISDYQYTLRAWRRDVYELFLDTDFFQMDLLSFRFWRIIIDRLVTYDTSVFKDLMQKIVLSQSGAINIFANREQEMEQRAQLLKRLSFVVFCGELDQYHQYIPEIHERLAESIRQLQGPFLHEQVFLCFRLLLVRMSPNHLISFWPPILTELVLVFVHMEHELVNNSGKPKNKSKVAVLESFLGINGYFKDPTKWLRLYLAVCKLLDFLLILPSDSLSHYQVYKWAFTETPGVYCIDNLEELVNDDGEDEANGDKTSPETAGNDKETRLKRDSSNAKSSRTEEVSKMAVLNSPISEQKRLAQKHNPKAKSGKDSGKHGKDINTVFLPYITRIMKILRQKKGLGEDSWHTPLRVPGELILLQKKIQTIYDLLPFFIAVTGDLVKEDVDVMKFARFKMQPVEELIEKDFIENSSSLT